MGGEFVSKGGLVPRLDYRPSKVQRLLFLLLVLLSCQPAPAPALALAVLSGRPPPLGPGPHLALASCRFKNEEYPSYFQGQVSKS